MEGYKDSVKLYEGALNSAGVAQQKFDLYQEGTAAKLAKLSNSWSGVWQSAFQSSAIQAVIGALTHVATATDNLVKAVGLLPVAITTAVLAFALFSTTVRGFVFGTGSGLLTWFGMSSARFKGMTLDLALLGTQMGITSGAARVLAVSIMGIVRAFAPLAIIGGVTWAISELISHFSKLSKEQKEFEAQQHKIATNWSTQQEKIQSLLSEQSKLQESDERYLEISNELASLMPNLVQSIDDKGQAHLKSADAIRQELEYAQKLADLEQNQRIVDSNDQFKDQIKSVKDLQKEIEYARSQMNSGYSDGKAAGRKGGSKLTESDVNKLEMRVLGLENQIASSTNVIRDNVNTLARDVLEVSGIKLSENITKELDNITKSLDVSALSPEELAAKANAIAAFFTNASSLNSAKSIQQAEALSKTTFDLGHALGYEDSQIQAVIASQKNLENQQAPVVDSTFDFATASTALSDAFDEAKKAISPLNQALDDLAKGQSLSSETVADLILQYPELANHIKKTKDGWIIEKDAIESVRNAQIQLEIDTLNAQMSMSNAAYNALATRLTLYDIEIDKINNLKDAMDAAAKLNTVTVAGASPALRNMGNTVTDKIEKEVMDLGKAREQLAGLEKVLRDPGLGTSGDGKKDKEKKEKAAKDVATFRDLTKERIAAINAESIAQDKLNKSLEDKAKTAQSEKKYQDAVKLTTALIKGEQLEITKLGTANKNLQNEIGTLQKNHPNYKMAGWLDQNGEASLSFGKFINGLKSKKAQDEVQALFDKYHDLTQAIKDNNVSIDENKKSIIENQKAIDSIRLEGTQLWLDKLTKSYSDLDDQIDTSKAVQSLYADGTKEYNAEIEHQVSLLDDKKKAVQDDISAIESKINNNQNLIASERLTADQIKALTDDLKERKRTLLDVQKAEYDYAVQLAQNVIDIQNKVDQTVIDSYQSQIDSLQEQWDLEAQIEERAKRITEISQLQNQLSVIQSGNIATISDQLVKQLGLEQEKAEAQQRQNDLIKQRQVLENVKKEKNVRLFQNGRFEWVADPRKIREEQDILTEMQTDFDKWRTDKLDSLQNDLKSKQEEYSRWELEQSRRQTIEQIQEQIKAKEEEIKLRNEKFEEEKMAWGIHGVDLNTILTSTLETLKGTYGTKWDEILTVLASKLASARQMYAEMLSMSSAQSSSAGSGGSGGSPSSSTSTVSDRESKLQQMANNSSQWNSASASERKRLESENAKIGKELGGNFNSSTGKWDIRKYAEGGLNTDTGLAWLDGTPENPELVLKADDTKNFLSALKITEKMPDILSHIKKNLLLTNLQIKMPDFSSLMKPNSVSAAGTGDTIHINHLEIKTNDSRNFWKNVAMQSKNK